MKALMEGGHLGGRLGRGQGGEEVDGPDQTALLPDAEEGAMQGEVGALGIALGDAQGDALEEGRLREIA